MMIEKAANPARLRLCCAAGNTRRNVLVFDHAINFQVLKDAK